MLKHQFVLSSDNIKNEEITLWINSSYIINKLNIDDDFILKISKMLDNLETIWVTSNENRKIHNNLNYYGITIIPNKEIEKFLEIIKETKNDKIIKELIELLENKKENELFIHFGI